jgi:hypothetical protein
MWLEIIDSMISILHKKKLIIDITCTCFTNFVDLLCINYSAIDKNAKIVSSTQSKFELKFLHLYVRLSTQKISNYLFSPS